MNKHSDKYEEALLLRKSGLTYQEIGERFSISRQRVHQILSDTNYKIHNPTSKDDCINWTKCKNSHGYGIIYKNHKTYKAHRYIWEQTNGSIPDGMYVLHKCDNPSCINLDHLYLGNTNDNIRDRVERNRSVGNNKYGDGMKRSIQINLVMSEDERAILVEMAQKRRRSLSDYIRWLIGVDYDTAYRLTDAGREALEIQKGDGD